MSSMSGSVTQIRGNEPCLILNENPMAETSAPVRVQVMHSECPCAGMINIDFWHDGTIAISGNSPHPGVAHEEPVTVCRSDNTRRFG
jgi:hypothetical protein